MELSRPETEREPPEKIRRRRWTRFLPLVLVLAALVAAVASGATRYLSLDTLQAKRDALQAAVRLHPVLGLIAYAALYAAVVALSLPGALIMSLSGGFLFGPWLGSAAAVAGASTGATIIFLVARTALGDLLRGRAGGMIEKIEQGARTNAFSYLFVLRLIPAVPFWLINLAAGFVSIPLRTFVTATALGIVPSTLIYTSIGAGLGHAFDSGRRPDMGLIFEPRVLLPLVGLAVLSVAPVCVHAWHARRRRATAGPAR